MSDMTMHPDEQLLTLLDLAEVGRAAPALSVGADISSDASITADLMEPILPGVAGDLMEPVNPNVGGGSMPSIAADLEPIIR